MHNATINNNNQQGWAITTGSMGHMSRLAWQSTNNHNNPAVQ